jgi:hypothetical protein
MLMWVSEETSHTQTIAEPLTLIMWGHSKKMAIYEPDSSPLPDTKPAYVLILDFQAPEL